MKAWTLDGGWGLGNLKLTERPRPEPGPGQVLIKVRACSLNYRDTLIVRGSYNPKQRLPLIPLSDGVGEVVAVGEGVTRVAAGTRVASCFSQTWTGGEPDHHKLRGTLGSPLDGMLAEYALLGAEGVTPVPEHLTDEEAATLPCAAVTAWSALVKYGRLKAGETVLVQGTGGVSIFALQIAKLFGAAVVATSSSDDKLARAKALGADHLINYKTTPEWDKEARALTGKVGVDHVVEVGGAGTLERSLRAVKIGGRIAVIGVLSGPANPFNVLPILMGSIRLQGVTVGSREDFEQMNRAFTANRLRPVVDRVFSFDETVQAFEYLKSGKHLGKVVIRVS